MSCENCFKPNVLPGTPTGTVTKLDGYPYDVYTSTSTEGTKKAIVILTDIFGLLMPNPKVTADALKEKLGADVYVPDLFGGAYAYDRRYGR